MRRPSYQESRLGRGLLGHRATARNDVESAVLLPFLPHLDKPGSGDNHGPVASAEVFRALLESHEVTIYSTRWTTWGEDDELDLAVCRRYLVGNVAIGHAPLSGASFRVER